MPAIRDAWAGFLSRGRTRANRRVDFSAWHRGRARYACWVLLLSHVPALARRMAEARRALDGLLLPAYRRQAHLTLHACGFPCAQPRWPDDFGPQQFAAQVAALERAAPAPFTLRIDGLGSFPTAPFLAVSGATEALARLRRALAVAGEEARDTPYCPHVTLGLYNGAHPAGEIARRRSRLVRRPPLAVSVEAVSLVSYASPLLAGPLDTLCTYDLARRLLLPGDGAYPGAPFPFVTP